MKLLLMRHGEAEPHAVRDSERRLTVAGQQEVMDCAEALQRRNIAPSIILASPYTRAQQTAELMAQVFGGLPISTSDGITPNVEPATAAATINAEFEESDGVVLVVMHQPIISGLLLYLTGVRQPMSTANLAVLEVPSLTPGFCEIECVI